MNTVVNGTCFDDRDYTFSCLFQSMVDFVRLTFLRYEVFSSLCLSSISPSSSCSGGLGTQGLHL